MLLYVALNGYLAGGEAGKSSPVFSFMGCKTLGAALLTLPHDFPRQVYHDFLEASTSSRCTTELFFHVLGSAKTTRQQCGRHSFS
jgi:hypothetical protein